MRKLLSVCTTFCKYWIFLMVSSLSSASNFLPPSSALQWSLCLSDPLPLYFSLFTCLSPWGLPSCFSLSHSPLSPPPWTSLVTLRMEMLKEKGSQCPGVSLGHAISSPHRAPWITHWDLTVDTHDVRLRGPWDKWSGWDKWSRSKYYTLWDIRWRRK